MISESVIKTSIKLKVMLVIFTLEGIIISREKWYNRLNVIRLNLREFEVNGQLMRRE